LQNNLQPNPDHQDFNLNFAGIMPSDTVGMFYPFSTQWNGLDDDGDWEPWADENGWWDDDDGDGNPQDRGEWGFTYLDQNTGNVEFLYPYEVGSYTGTQIGNNQIIDGISYSTAYFDAVGVDEWSTVTGLSEAELVPSRTGIDSTFTPGTAYSPPHIILSSLNYGDVWIQGLDMSVTHFLTTKIMIDGNFSWYNSTDYYNELTKKNEPINAPQFKWNGSIKWDSPIGALAINYRYVDQFEWSDGLWSGTIGPYNLIDIHYNYKINKYLSFNMTAMNIFNDVHRELIGGAKMGRQIIFRLSSSM